MINSTAGFRDNYKKMVIVFTSSYGHYRSSPKDIGTYLKSSGVSLVTVNTGSDKNVNAYLKQVASDNLSFAMTDGNVTAEIMKAMTDNFPAFRCVAQFLKERNS
uniref:VWFA domain-containing protein n=1 Tax=Caenorhabditis japonica TaxID=281687 RepID=A0A8R1IJE3_CAEJA